MSRDHYPLIGAEAAIRQYRESAFVEVAPWRTMTAGTDATSGSVPGAHATTVQRHFAGRPTAGSGHLPLPPPDRTRAIAARWRTTSSDLILYTRRIEEFASATRAWFVLSAAGIPRVSVLDGGLPAWVRAGGELGDPADEGGSVTGAVPDPAPSEVRVLSTAQAKEVARFGTLLDARPEDAYHGVAGQPRTGHVPGARHASVSGLLRPDGTLLPPAGLRRWFLAHHAIGRHEVGAYCNGGVASSTIVFAGYLIRQQVGLYIDSWSGWEKDGSLPVQQGQPRLRPGGQDFDCFG